MERENNYTPGNETYDEETDDGKLFDSDDPSSELGIDRIALGLLV